MSNDCAPCRDCGLPDLHDGDGDGIGSCDCSRCEDCWQAPWICGCHDDYDWFDATDGRPRVETITVVGGAL